MLSYRIDKLNRTVLVRQVDGSVDDLNASGDPCRTDDDLVTFVDELARQGCYPDDVRRELMCQCAGDPSVWVQADVGTVPS